MSDSRPRIDFDKLLDRLWETSHYKWDYRIDPNPNRKEEVLSYTHKDESGADQFFVDIRLGNEGDVSNVLICSLETDLTPYQNGERGRYSLGTLRESQARGESIDEVRSLYQKLAQRIVQQKSKLHSSTVDQETKRAYASLDNFLEKGE